MATLADMVTDIRLLTMGNLDKSKNQDTIKGLLNRAHQQVLEAFDWTFLLTNTVINSVAPKTAGTVTVSQGSSTVLGTGTAFGPEDDGAFIWLGGLSTSPVPIVGVPGTAVLTLSNPWAGPTLINAGYVILPLYYLVEGASEVLAIRGQQVYLGKVSREWINYQDPSRSTQGAIPCLKWAMAPASPDGSVQVELWPPSGGPMPYLVEYKRTPPIMVDPFDKPLIPYEIVEEKAAMTACQMMYASTGQQSWLALADKHEELYLAALETGRHEDSKRAKALSGVTSDTRSPVELNAQYNALHDSN